MSISNGSIIKGMQIAGTGLKAERMRMDTIARNISNAGTTRMPGGQGPYRRQMVTFEPLLERSISGSMEVQGVRVASVSGDYSTAFEMVKNPGHQDADENGMVEMPNVNTLMEMVDLVTATRAYEANMSVQENFKTMAQRALRLAE